MHRADAPYDWYLIETYTAHGEPSANRVRARPLPGQGLPPTMKVECSRGMRLGHPVGTVFRVKAQVVENQNGTRFLYTHFNWPFEVVSPPAHAFADAASTAWCLEQREADVDSLLG